jgi:WD40 repeat protein
VIASAQGWGAFVQRQELGDRLIRLSPHPSAWFVAVSPHGDWIATGCFGFADVYVKVWNGRTGAHVVDLPVEGSSLVGFSPDGNWLATNGGGCRLWRVGTWQEGPKIQGREFAFSPDSRVLGVESGLGAIRLVDPETGREYARLEDPNHDRARCLAFSPDGTQIAVTTGDSAAVHLWDLRAIRAELDKRGLDWELPAFPPADAQTDNPPLRVTVATEKAPPQNLK